MEEPFFKFEIGEIVRHRLKGERYLDKGFTTHLLIVERMYHECIGGSQIYYNCRMSLHNHSTSVDPNKLYAFGELELEEIPVEESV